MRFLSELTCGAHSNHIVAVSRGLCAFVLVLFAFTKATGFGLQGGYVDLFALTYAVFAFFALIIAFNDWYLDFIMSEAFIGLDVLAFLALTVPPMDDGLTWVLLSLCLIAHILFSSVLRWRLGLVLAIAAFLNAVWIGDILIVEVPRGTVAWASLARWGLFVPLGSLVIVWVSSQMIKSNLPRFAGETPGPGYPITASAMSYAMGAADAADAVLCWIDRENLGCFSCTPSALEQRLAPRKLSFGAADRLRQLEPMLFDLARNRAIVSARGQLSACKASALPGFQLLKELGVERGLCIPANGEDGATCLILTGIPMLGWGHLYLAHAIASEVAQGVAWQVSAVNALDRALSRLRKSVACDLHDSVAQSLVGAKFLLVALRSKAGADPEIVGEIDAIKDALAAEHIHVRRLIEQLRETNSDARVRNLIDDLEGTADALALRWQITVDIIESDYRVPVPVWLSLEIQQIVREAVANSVRHGEASLVTIKCRMRAVGIEIEVTDNGHGFGESNEPIFPRSIRERLSERGGTIEIVSHPGSTSLRMRVPVDDLD
ncbi:histidine kinase [Novosphingobium pentaromativorans US6-1]|nr:histidine kinase [Novosphingobium pentaromativorans US6-1]